MQTYHSSKNLKHKKLPKQASLVTALLLCESGFVCTGPEGRDLCSLNSVARNVFGFHSRQMQAQSLPINPNSLYSIMFSDKDL